MFWGSDWFSMKVFLVFWGLRLKDFRAVIGLGFEVLGDSDGCRVCGRFVCLAILMGLGLV